MKKILLLFAAVAAIACTSCNKSAESSSEASASTDSMTQTQASNDSSAVTAEQSPQSAEVGTPPSDSPEPTGDPAKDATTYVNYMSKFFKSVSSEEDMKAKQNQIMAVSNKFSKYYKENGKEKEFSTEVAKHTQEMQQMILEVGKKFAKQRGMTDEQIATGEQVFNQLVEAKQSAGEPQK